MKSPMVHESGSVPEADRANYSELQVLRSPAGYYIGTLYEERDDAGEVVFTEPGTRESGYFVERDAALVYLSTLEAGLSMPLRETP